MAPTLLVFALQGAFLMPLAKSRETRYESRMESSCTCLGAKATHGHCGFHLGVEPSGVVSRVVESTALNAMAQTVVKFAVKSSLQSGADAPWCRTMRKCGRSSSLGSWIGSWDYCDVRGVERHWDSWRNGYYSAKDFQKFYGSEGRQKWIHSKVDIERREGYTVMAFREYYIGSEGERGWVERWVAAEPPWRVTPVIHYPSPWETCKDRNGQWYTWAEFERYYGARALEMWNCGDWGSQQHTRSYDSWETRKAPNGRWYTWAEFQQHYGPSAQEMWNAGSQQYTGSDGSYSVSWYMWHAR